MSKKISLIIGIVLFMLIIGSSYAKMSTEDSINSQVKNYGEAVSEQAREIVYKGKFPIPVENFMRVSSGFGRREAHGVVHANHTGIDLVREWW